MNQQEVSVFQETVWAYYAAHARDDLPWRQPNAAGVFDPYHILVSELMLQQTQVQRVVPKYQEFLDRFPDAATLAVSELGEVLRVWQGLGYNRRAKFLWQAAGCIHTNHADIFPNTLDELVVLPGVGKNTAGAILAYAFNTPVPFIETNIRTIYIHHFFADQDDITDVMILPYITESLPDDPSLTRDWYWALMDYGTHLKATIGNLNKLSKTYTKQSTFVGSRRQVRGAVIRALSKNPLTLSELQMLVADQRLENVLDDLVQEGMVRHNNKTYSL
jgi:A/G-specific adenine glycosylase